MDRNYWMYEIRRTDPRFVTNMKFFLKIAQEDRVKKGNELVPCPCMECKNFTDFKDIRDIEYHLLRNGFMFNYTCWSKHGESLANRSTTSINLGSNYNDENNALYIRDDSDNLNEGYDNINEVNDNLNDMRDDLEANADDSDLEKLQYYLPTKKNRYMLVVQNFLSLAMC
ncbi:putative Transposase-associated domain-containing protein [Helianthus annuus]|nr:putative Transposase-associated domain-containing protein [Helianthus annuus]